MTQEQTIMVAAIGIAAYLLFKSKYAAAATTTYPGYTTSYPSGIPTSIPTQVPSTGIPTIPEQGISSGGIAYTSGNFSIEVPWNAIKGAFTDIYTAIKGGEKPTITPANELTSSLFNLSTFSA